MAHKTDIQPFATGGFVPAPKPPENSVSAVLTRHWRTTIEGDWKLPEPKAADTVVIEHASSRWVERWHGSGGAEGHEGWSILNAETRELVCYLGRGVESAAVTEIVQAHNAAINDKLAILAEVHSWIVCAPLATPEDMMQNAPRICEITAPGYQFCLTCGNMGAVGTADRAEPCPTCSKGAL